MREAFFLYTWLSLWEIPLLGEMSRSIYADVTKGSRFRQKELSPQVTERAYNLA